MDFDRYVLSNGIRVIGEKIPHFRSVSIGIWIGAGSQYEVYPEAGMSHFIEHMVFKGTEKRTALEIAEEMDVVGGQLNAFTSKELTCLYAKVVDEHLPLAIDVLCDMATSPKFANEDMDREKGVVLEEINMSEDSPEDLVHELIMLAHFGDQPVARPILGHPNTLNSFTRENLLDYWDRMYRPENMVVALAGNYDWDEVLEMLEKSLSKLDKGRFKVPAFTTNNCEPGRLARDKDIEQVHICVGYPGEAIGSELGYEFSLFSSVLGGSMSSRLFQKIREQSGMAYSVYSYPNSYTDCGMLSIYAATNPELYEKVLEMILQETDKVRREGITQKEFAMAREQLKSGFILGQESTSSRMMSLGRRMLLLNETRSETQVIDRINGMTLEKTNEVIKKLMSGPYSVALVGKGMNGR